MPKNFDCSALVREEHPIYNTILGFETNASWNSPEHVQKALKILLFREYYSSDHRHLKKRCKAVRRELKADEQTPPSILTESSSSDPDEDFLDEECEGWRGLLDWQIGQAHFLQSSIPLQAPVVSMGPPPKPNLRIYDSSKTRKKNLGIRVFRISACAEIELKPELKFAELTRKPDKSFTDMENLSVLQAWTVKVEKSEALVRAAADEFLAAMKSTNWWKNGELQAISTEWVHKIMAITLPEHELRQRFEKIDPAWTTPSEFKNARHLVFTLVTALLANGATQDMEENGDRCCFLEPDDWVTYLVTKPCELIQAQGWINGLNVPFQMENGKSKDVHQGFPPATAYTSSRLGLSYCNSFSVEGRVLYGFKQLYKRFI